MTTTGYGTAQAIVDADIADVISQLEGRLEPLSGAIIVITGASGMLGGYLTDVAAALNPLGILRSACTLYLATRQPPIKAGRLGHLLGRRDVHFIVGDATAAGELPERADVVIHAASPASPRAYVADPVGTLDANSRYLRAMLLLAQTSGARSVLYVSSSEIYGNPPPDAIPTPETFVGTVDPQSARACYAEAKRFGEALSMAYHRQHQLHVNVVRPFHIHGPGLRLDDGRIVADLIRAGLEGVPFMLASDGSATRCYGYVSDATVGMYQALLSSGGGDTFNLGADSPETTILDLAGLVAELTGSPPPRTSTDPLPPHLAGAPNRSRPDLSKARAVLGYAPRVSLRDGLSRTIAWHRAGRSLEA